MKVSDEFTVPLCRIHHRQLHDAGNEVTWWEKAGITPLEVAKELWEESRRPPQSPSSEASANVALSNQPDDKET